MATADRAVRAGGDTPNASSTPSDSKLVHTVMSIVCMVRKRCRMVQNHTPGQDAGGWRRALRRRDAHQGDELDEPGRQSR